MSQPTAESSQSFRHHSSDDVQFNSLCKLTNAERILNTESEAFKLFERGNGYCIIMLPILQSICTSPTSVSWLHQVRT